MMKAAVSSSGLRPATCPTSTLVTGTGATRASSSSGSMPAAAARSRMATIWMAPVAMAFNCSSAWSCHARRPASTMSTSISPSRTAFSPAATVSYRWMLMGVSTASPCASRVAGSSVGIEPARPMSLAPGPVSSSAGSAIAAATAMSISTSDRKKPRERPRSRISRSATSQLWRTPFMLLPPAGTAPTASAARRRTRPARCSGGARRSSPPGQYRGSTSRRASPSPESTSSIASSPDQSGLVPR